MILSFYLRNCILGTNYRVLVTEELLIAYEMTTR
jgi:hypothetical protein